MEFKKYPSITNSYDTKFIEKIKEYGFDKELYYVTEKVHGTNFAIYYDGEKFRIASRTHFLADDANFYGCQNFLPELKEKIKSYVLHETINACHYANSNFPIKEIVLYGEICGGRYPHKDITQNNGAKKVQGHVWYHPENIFYLFDAKINGKFLSKPEFMYLSLSLQSWFTGKIGYAQVLCTGSLKECLSYPNEYYTHIPRRFRLPEIENNICEGNIIKPVNPLFFPNCERVILKNKNERFAEISRKKEPHKEKKELSEETNKLIGILLTYITENRLNNVISKLGEVTIKDFGNIIQVYAKDIIDEFTNINNEYVLLEKQEQKQLRKILNNKASELIRNYFKLK